MSHHALAIQSQPTLASPEGPLRIGFFTDTYVPQVNGIAISLQLLARGLRQAGHEVTIFTPRVPGYRDSEAGVHRIPAVRYMNMPPVYLAIPGTPRATLAMGRCQFDVVHVHSPLSLGLLAYLTASAKGLPLIYTYHTSLTDYAHYVKGIGQTRPMASLARWFSTATCNLGDRIVAPSVKFQRLLGEQNVRRPIHVIPNGIDLKRFYESSPRGAYRRLLLPCQSTPRGASGVCRRRQFPAGVGKTGRRFSLCRPHPFSRHGQSR
jgi:1,2-diacylglycerol 3-alpha-glucosyltransferase